jgi:outer membrane autotransporter protein
MHADVTHVTGGKAGSNQIDSYSLGAYWTHFWANDSYLDAIAQYSWHHARARSLLVPELNADFAVLALSLEVGRPFPLLHGWVLEPQAQLTWQRFNGTSADDVAAQITFADTDSLTGRLGLRAAKTWKQSEGPDAKPITAWVRLNYRHDFLDRPTTDFSSEDGPVRFTADPGRNWLEGELGFTGQIGRKAALYGTGGYDWDLGRNGHAWTGRIGLRFDW